MTPVEPILQFEPSARILEVRIQKGEVIVEVEAAGDLARVTLESSPRLGRRAWEPRGVKTVSTTASAGPVRFTFSIPVSAEVEILRVRADRIIGTLPAAFFEGTNKFTAGLGGAGDQGGGVVPGGMQVPSRSAVDAGEGAPRDVVESDIWRVDGDTLYFFNQYRGLQVINVTDPDAPKLSGTYDLAGAGEQMYVIDQTKVVLLARDNCSWYGEANQSRILLLEVRDGTPVLVKELAVPGTISESRLVGDALYVVGNSYQLRTTARAEGKPPVEEWTWGSDIVSFDLQNFAEAKEKSRQWVKGYGNAILATDRFLFVAQTDYSTWPPSESQVHCFDISSPDGTFAPLSVFGAGGTVQDKFKMHLDGNVFVAVVQQQTRESRSVYVHTISLEDPKAPQALGRLKIIDNEQLFATRFDGHLLYAVTFFVVDPLWVIDLSNPAEPKKVGELEIPGWSTYLRPMGDRLLAIGLDRVNGYQKTAVQLFDVADPSRPSLLSKVFIGEEWSGSEANWDEKAFGVLPEDKLILVPFHASGAAGYTQGVQLIDLEKDRLVKRGVITQNMGARRATLHRERILSISSTELLSVNAADRDRPSITGVTQLSWAADKVHLAGAHVIEVDSTVSTGPVLRVVQAEESGTLLKSVALTNLPYMGSERVGNVLYVLQGKSAEFIYPKVYDPNNWAPIATNPAVYLLSKFDLAALPELTLVAQTVREGGAATFYGQYRALRVRPDLLVWTATLNNYGPWWRWGGPEIDAMARPGAALVGGRGIPFWGWGGSSGHLLATDLSGETPKFVSEVTLSGTNGWWNFGETFTVDGLIFSSHQSSEFDPEIDPPAMTWDCYDGTKMVTCTNDPPPGVWVTRYYLDVIDFKDPADPLVRRPVNIPGTLEGIDRGGELLFTRGQEMSGFHTSGEESLSALSYDGVQAHLLSQIPLTNSWPRPSAVDRGFVYLGQPAPASGGDSALQTWKLNDAGKFEQVNSLPVPSAIQEFRFFGGLLAAQASEVLLFNATQPGAPALIGSGKANSCYGVLLRAADGEVERGLWIPVGWYGVIKIPAKKSEPN